MVLPKTLNSISARLSQLPCLGVKILAAHWLWNSRMDGAVFELILLGLSAIFWYGLALPLGPLLGIIEVVLLALAWGSLH